MIDIIKANELFLREVCVPPIELNAEDYKLRLHKLVERMNSKGLTHVLIYGDREHFSNVEYFTRYDCRFEETLFIVGADGKPSIIVGNEGIGFSTIIPYEIERYLYQNFSLQGQPRDKVVPLNSILNEIGITKQSNIGIVGVKYFEQSFINTEPAQTYDLPHYIVGEIEKACEHICNITDEITGLPNGIRMVLYTAKEIAWAEAAGNRTAAVIQRMFKNVKPGMKEYELAELCQVGFDALNSHPLTNFGSESVAIGMGSPRNIELDVGEVCGFSYSIRGNLTSRVGIAAYGPDTCKEELKPYIDNFYKKYYEGIAAWYETVKVGATGGELYDAVMSLIGGEEFGVTLNPGHNTGADEWTNSPSYKGSEIPLVSGAFMQVDIIASRKDPVRTAICEDAVVIADPSLRKELEEQFPEVYKRILERQKVIREVLGIVLHDDVLPMSNLNGVYFPFMLNREMVFGKRQG